MDKEKYEGERKELKIKRKEKNKIIKERGEQKENGK